MNLPTAERLRALRCDRRRRRGAIVVMAAICLIVAAAFLAFAVDYGYLSLAESQLQNAADAAAYSGARALAKGPDAARSAAQLWAGKNQAAGKSVELSISEDVEVGLWNAETRQFTPLASNSSQTPNAIRVTCRRTAQRGDPINLFFAPLLGIHHADVVASATAVAPGGYGVTFQFLIDDEMFDTDEKAIEDLAKKLKVTPDALLKDADKDGFIDLPPGSILELPTGQVGDEALFDIQSYSGAFPFGEKTHYTYLDFLAEGTALKLELGTKTLQNVEWKKSNAPHKDLEGKKLLDPTPGVDPVKSHAAILALPNPEVVHLSPVFKSDVSMAERDPKKYGSPAANLQGERRGLVAFKILSARPSPYGGSYLPWLTIEIVSPAEIDLDDVCLDVTDVVAGPSSGKKVKLTH